MYPVPTGNIAKDKIAPVAEALGDVACDCNTFYINEALGGDTYYYRFSLYPGIFLVLPVSNRHPLTVY